MHRKVFSKQESATNILPMKIAIEAHVARVSDALSSAKKSFDILTVLYGKFEDRDFANSGNM
jgi:hypothetical protein